ncbi:Transposase zinc-ribbon domain protein [compost metagenome]
MVHFHADKGIKMMAKMLANLTGSLPAKSRAGQTTAAEERVLDTEGKCVSYLFSLKWPSGFECPACGHTRAYTIATRRLPLYECANCRRQASLITDTVMEGSRTSLVKWFDAIRLMSQDEGISAMALSRILSVTYKTAWSMLTRIRTAMAKNELSIPLEGPVEVHKAAYACPAYHNSVVPHARETKILIGATITGEGELERISFQPVKREHQSNGYILSAGLKHFADTRLSRSAELNEYQFRRYTSPRNKKALPWFKQARHWLNTTFHGIGKKYLEKYLLEFCCRANLVLSGTPLFPAISRICAGRSAA